MTYILDASDDASETVDDVPETTALVVPHRSTVKGYEKKVLAVSEPDFYFKCERMNATVSRHHCIKTLAMKPQDRSTTTLIRCNNCTYVAPPEQRISVEEFLGQVASDSSRTVRPQSSPRPYISKGYEEWARIGRNMEKFGRSTDK